MPTPRRADRTQTARKARRRAELRDAGLKPVTVWIRPGDEAAVRDYDRSAEVPSAGRPADAES